MKFAYADPPYLGCGAKHYGAQHEDASAYDSLDAHRELIVRLRDEYPDGWALSLHSPSLEDMLILCREVVGPKRVRISPWVKPFASYKPGVNPSFSWEPVIWLGGRSAKERGGREVPTVKDFHSANITMQRGTSGALQADDGDFHVSVVPSNEHGDFEHEHEGEADLFACCYSASVRIRAPMIGGGSHPELWHALASVFRALPAERIDA